jgi:hypothetical protein
MSALAGSSGALNIDLIDQTTIDTIAIAQAPTT